MENPIKLTVLITVAKEQKELDLLCDKLIDEFDLVPLVGECIELFFLMDTDNVTDGVMQRVNHWMAYFNEADSIAVNSASHPFGGDFAQFKNTGVSLCKGEFVLQLDVDETPSPSMIARLLLMIKNNPSINKYAIARKNTVEGITADDIKRWNWNVDKDGLINFPDYQQRVLRNDGTVLFKGTIHTVLAGGGRLVSLPAEMCWLNHPKTIDRQRFQNALYTQMEKKSN